MRPSLDHDALVAVVNRRPVAMPAWRSFWDRVRDRSLRPGEAVALVSSLSTHPPDATSVAALLASLRAQGAIPPPLRRTVNVVGTGGGPPTFNLSTAAAFVAASLGVRVVKTGSRAYTSRCGSIDLIERLGIPLTTSYEQTATTVDAFGIAFAGGFVYPKELRLLAASILPFDMRSVGRFFNTFGPFLAAVPVSAQVTGVSDPRLLPHFIHLTALEPDRRYLLCTNGTGVDEFVSWADNLIYDSHGRQEPRLRPRLLGLGGGSLAQLRPATGYDDLVAQFLALIAGDGPPAAIESIRLNAAALAVAGGLFDDWSEALRAARDSMTRGLPVRLIDRIRSRCDDVRSAEGA